jgi:hypothetical protein
VRQALFLLPFAMIAVYTAIIALRFPDPFDFPGVPLPPRLHHPIMVNPEASLDAEEEIELTRHHPILVSTEGSIEAELDIELGDPKEFAELWREAREEMARKHAGRQ